jgi:hypothetical protein
MSENIYKTLYADYVVGHPNDPNSVPLTLEEEPYTAALVPYVFGGSLPVIIEHIEAKCRRLGGEKGSPQYNDNLVKVDLRVSMEDGKSYLTGLWVYRGREPVRRDYDLIRRHKEYVESELTKRVQPAGRRIDIEFPKGYPPKRFPVVVCHGDVRRLIIVPQMKSQLG